jgi:hypothetical protein
MSRKILLKSRPEPVSFTLIGISCHLQDYRLLHRINTEIGFEFSREDDLRVSIPGETEPPRFAFFLYRDEDQRNSYCLVSNFCRDIMLIREFRNTDYVMLIEGDFKKQKKDYLLKQLRAIPNIITAFEINFKDIKNPETFLTDLEMHVSGIRMKNRIKPMVKTK